MGDGAMKAATRLRNTLRVRAMLAWGRLRRLMRNKNLRAVGAAVVTLALLAWLLCGGPAIHSFTAVMTFGVVLVGTYTSIFIAAPILIYLGVGESRADVEEKPAKPEKLAKPEKPAKSEKLAKSAKPAKP